MAELVTSTAGATVDGVLRLTGEGFTPVEGYQVTVTRTAGGLRYDVLTPAGDQLSWTAPEVGAQLDAGLGADAAPRVRVGGRRSSPAAEGRSEPDVARGRTLILGGARSGKSTAAERLLADTPDTLYVATGGDGSSDPEWADRIAKHRERRPASWGLAETIDLVPLLEPDGPPLLIDCLTLWLARTMDACDIWDHPENLPAVEQRIDDLAAAWSGTPRLVVAVSNEVGSGVVPGDAGTRLFRDLMGRVNATISRESDTVLWCVAGRTVAL
ncbi:bifunctional adenosylcobinamide kinase/adenosylcobinamide-phosphate guanylyltransferase [Kribbella sp. DT2]|uniref:bifunctional adenosylcobinamide kinase/adenosylcobinamide-phosphate guanylyltransferase n=1 Tax=Kribbella sp. DT2 TaxID=3393427 RepID=UPI003CE7BB33